MFKSLVLFSSLLFLFLVRYLCPVRMTQQTTLIQSVRTLKTCTAGSQEQSSASGDLGICLTTPMTTERRPPHQEDVIKQTRERVKTAA